MRRGNTFVFAMYLMALYCWIADSLTVVNVFPILNFQKSAISLKYANWILTIDQQIL